MGCFGPAPLESMETLDNDEEGGEIISFSFDGVDLSAKPPSIL